MGELCLVDEIAEETLLKSALHKDAAAAPAAAAEAEIPPSHVMPHDAIKPSTHSLLNDIHT